MQQPPAAPQQGTPKFHLILNEQAVRQAWFWVVTNANLRPGVRAGNCCVYDQKHWRQVNSQALMFEDIDCISCLARLFLTSQLTNDVAEIIGFIQGREIGDIGIFSEKLETPIRDLIEDEKRFRHALSEHIAFWIQLVSIIQSCEFTAFTVTPPNYLPEDKGPDGLSLVINHQQAPRIELRSVKSSIGDPYYLIASGAFRKSEEDEPDPEKQLEEFYLISHGIIGFGRLDRLLSVACNSLNFSAGKYIRSGILGHQRSFNATVVSDDHFGRYEMFSCFGRISSTPSDCIATYIGSDCWSAFAESVRNCVLEILEVARVL